MNDKDKELQSGSAAIVFFTVLSSTTAVATALLPFFFSIEQQRESEMYHDFNYRGDAGFVAPRAVAARRRACATTRSSTSRATSCRRAWPGRRRSTRSIPFEQRILNQISAHQYLSIFGDRRGVHPAVPARSCAAASVWATTGGSARSSTSPSEEAKHIHLFKRFHAAFVRGFPVECQVIGPSEAIGAEVLRHDPLAVGLVILMIEWMTQQHYLGSIRDDGDLDPLFKSLMRHHWMEEAQHAKLDTLIVEALAEGRSEEQIDKAIDEFFEIGAFLDDGLKTQAGFNLDALEKAIGRKVENRDAILAQQHQAARWTYIGSGMVHERFKATLETLSPRAAAAHRRSRPDLRLNQPITTTPRRKYQCSIP